MSRVSADFVELMRATVGAAHVVTEAESLETLSKDFYWYSPVLRGLLADKRAEVGVRPGSIDELKAVISQCHQAGVPLVMRGGGTGNYGQCIPLHGGVVIDVSRLDRIHEITTDGVARCEPGVRLAVIEAEARKVGWELRCLPSTWVKSSLAGFLCGGSGGIGSITWGVLAQSGTVKSVTVATVEAVPKVVRHEEADAVKFLHTYGTTGILVEIELRLAPKLVYDQVIFSHPSFETIMRWTDQAARDPRWHKRLVSGFEWPIPTYFKPLAKYLRPDEAISFFLVDQSEASALVAEAAAAGISAVFRSTLGDPPKPPLLTDYTYNHTTLWAMKVEPAFTYIQAGYGADPFAQIAQLKTRFPDELLFHFEWMAQRGRIDAASGRAVGENVGMGSIPLVRFKSPERLAELLAFCREIGVRVSNTHTAKMEESGKYPQIASIYALKAETDPSGILNPGKLAHYPVNPFATLAGK